MVDPPHPLDPPESALTAMLKAPGKPSGKPYPTTPSAGNGPLQAKQEVAAVMDDVERLCRHLRGIGAEVEEIGRIYRAECDDLAVAFRDRTELLIAKLVRLG